MGPDSVSDASRKLTKVGFAKDADWLARLYELLSLSMLAALFIASQTLNSWSPTTRSVALGGSWDLFVHTRAFSDVSTAARGR